MEQDDLDPCFRRKRSPRINHLPIFLVHLAKDHAARFREDQKRMHGAFIT